MPQDAGYTIDDIMGKRKKNNEDQSEPDNPVDKLNDELEHYGESDNLRNIFRK